MTDPLIGIWVHIEIIDTDPDIRKDGHQWGTVAISSSPGLGDQGVQEMLRSILETYDRPISTIDEEYRQ